MRRYLTAAAGEPISAEALASAVVDGVRKNKALVVPGRAALLARAQRLAPGVTAKQLAKNMARELRFRER